MSETKFKHINDATITWAELQLEQAYQLKRIADALESIVALKKGGS